jgi:hypothetical protein
MEKRYFGITGKNLISASKLRKVNNVLNEVSEEKRLAVTEWLRGFFRRNLSLSEPLGRHAVRIKIFAPENVKQFFSLCVMEMANIKYNPRWLFIIDYTRITDDQHKK